MILAYALLVLAVLVCAASAPVRERQPLMLLAGLFAVSWAIYITSWSAYSVGLLLPGVMHSSDVWQFMDAASGVAALALGRRYWWSVALWTVAVCQCVIHAMYLQFGVIEYSAYISALDKPFMAAACVFLLAGGKGVLDGISRVTFGGWVRCLGNSSAGHTARVIHESQRP